jgi:hypothetical protein
MSNENMRELPTSELDAQMMMTNSTWGRSDVPQELKDRLEKFYIKKAETGEILVNNDGTAVVNKSSLWGLLGFYSRDMRLGNLSEWNNELEVCRYHINLANDCLDENLCGSFLVSLSRSATILETSQSKGGFLRKILNTLTHRNINHNSEAPKKAFFGGSKKDNGGF